MASTLAELGQKTITVIAGEIPWKGWFNYIVKDFPANLYEYSMVKVLKTKEGNIQCDFSILDKYLACFFEAGIDKEIDVFGLLGVWQPPFFPLNKAVEHPEKLVIRYYDEEMQQMAFIEKQEELRQYFQQLFTYFKKKNIWDKVRLMADEPKAHEIDTFKEAVKRLKEIEPTLQLKVAFDKENKELISNISHDLKTPITAVKGYVEGIMDGVADTPEKMDRYIRTIYNKANEMDRLINELTFYSKIDTNRIPYTFNKIHISDYFEDCVDELSVELDSSGISLTYFNYLEEDAVVIADAEQLKRVINNIISNSLKYMNKPKGVINIRLRDVGDFIQIEIEDNGKGIAQKDLANIFERFYRTDASRNSSKGGSGIGLSIVKKIMEDHGGQVWATSKEGTGTTMYLALRKYQEVPVHE